MKALFSALLLLLMFSTGCINFNNSDNPVNQDWTYTLGKQDDTVSNAVLYTYQNLDSLIQLEKLLPEKEGFIWLRTEFVVPSEMLSKELYLSLGRITMADETYVNGHLVGKMGKFPPDYFSEWNSFRLYPVSSSVLFPNRENVLMIKIYINAEGALQGTPALLEKSLALEDYNYNTAINSTINALISFLLIMVGSYHLLIFINRPKDRENLYYALLSFAMSIYLANFFISKLPGFTLINISYLNFQKLIFITLFLITIITVLFFHSYLDLPVRKWLRYTLIAIAVVPTIIILIPQSYKVFFPIRFYVQIILLFPLVYLVYLLVYSRMKKIKFSGTLLLGTIPLWFCLFYDLIVHIVLKINEGVYLAGYGYPSFLVTMAAVLAKRFVSYHNEVEEYKENLEIKVKERTEELNKRNEELETAQNIMNRDMEMAENVQRSMFPREVPSTLKWDLSYAFKPMAGVSGDLYDFYENNGELIGASLLDVSGHGISSGLITILAKSIVQRNMMSMRDKPLNEVLSAINDDLILELNNVDNYLTGIILRVEGDTIEYVNAGHPELLCRRFETGNVGIVNLENQDIKGMYLGIEAMKSEYKVLKFKMQKNDILVVYSDCLIETENNGEEYGIERIMHTLKSTNESTSIRIRDKIIRDFVSFKWGTPSLNDLTANEFLKEKSIYKLDDDFTMLVLKRNL